MDILSALHDANPERGAKRCKVQRILDDIPDDTPGKDDLAAAVLSTEFAAQRLALTFTALDLSVGPDSIRDHRARRCYCYR